MKYLRKVSINYKVSLVICLIDDYSLGAISNADIIINGKLKKPIIKKKQGYYVLVNLEEKVCNITIKSGLYFDKNIVISLDEINSLDPIVYVKLKPKPNYSFSNGSTLVRVNIKDSQGKPVKDVNIKGIILSKECAVGKLMKKYKANKSKEISLLGVNREILKGDKFYIKDKENSEYCQIKDVSYKTNAYELCKTFKFNHNQGALLLPIVKTKSDSRGEGVIYFNNLRTKKVEVRLEFIYKETSINQDLVIEEGQTTVLGTINI